MNIEASMPQSADPPPGAAKLGRRIPPLRSGLLLPNFGILSDSDLDHPTMIYYHSLAPVTIA